MNKTVVTTAVAAVFALVVMAAVVGSARATYRGETNGRLAFGININGNTDVYSVQPNGQDLQRLTDRPGLRRLRRLLGRRQADRLLLGRGRRPRPGLDDESGRHGQTAGHAHERHRDLPRLLARREQDRLLRRHVDLRPRHLCRQQRRQRPHQADERRRQQRLSRLLAERPQDRLHQQPHRHLAGLADERRRLEPETAHLRLAAQGPGTRLEPQRQQDRLPGRHTRNRRHGQQLGRHLGDERQRLPPTPDHPEMRPTTAPPGHPTEPASPPSTSPPALSTPSTPETEATGRQSTPAASSSSPAGSPSAPKNARAKTRTTNEKSAQLIDGLDHEGAAAPPPPRYYSLLAVSSLRGQRSGMTPEEARLEAGSGEAMSLGRLPVSSADASVSG